MKRLGVFLLPPGWDASPSQGYPPSIKFADTHLYTWAERGTVRVKCLAQEHSTMSPVRARTRTARSGVERTNHEATAPPIYVLGNILFSLHGMLHSITYLVHRRDNPVKINQIVSYPFTNFYTVGQFVLRVRMKFSTYNERQK